MDTRTITLLDGGMGQELTRRADGPATHLWSADIIANQPELVEAVHSDFIAAGADVITLASYSATPARLAREGREDAFEALQASAVDAARRAIEAADRPVRLAGCLPPLPGSYRPDERFDAAESLEEYRRIVAAQRDAVDLFLCETLPSIEEARLATRAASQTDKPVWTALTVDETDGTRLRSGERVQAGARAARDEGAEAVLINCSPPEAAGVALAILLEQDGVSGAYANGFETIGPLTEGATVDALSTRKDFTPQRYADAVEDWIEAGAAIVGGCCETSPAHIAEIARRLGRSPSL